MCPKFKVLLCVRSELSIVKNRLLKGSGIDILQEMIQEMIQNIHDGHQGIMKYLERAKISVWWPGITSLIKNKV